MTRVHCPDCGEIFHRAPDEVWKRRCLSCYIQRKAAQSAPAAVDSTRQELADHMRALLGLCHPDKHGGSTLATTTTQWLLSVRNRIAERAQ